MPDAKYISNHSVRFRVRFHISSFCLQNLFVLGVAVEHLAAIGSDTHQVFNADAHPAWNVNARLNGEAHPLLYNHLVRGRHVKGLVYLHADAVPQPVGEEFAVACILNDLAGGAVNVLEGNARLYGGNPRSFPARCRETALPSIKLPI